MKVRTQVSKLALGTVQFGLSYGVSNTQGQVPEDEVARVLQSAWDAGVRTWDTARAYGTSEEVLGRARAKLGLSPAVVTKLPPLPTEATASTVGKWARQEFEKSLQALSLEKVDTLLLHREENLLGPAGEALWETLLKLRESGRVARIGVSSYEPGQLLEILNRFEITATQVPFNLLDRRFVTPELAHAFSRRGVEVHVRSVYLQGLFFMKPESCPPEMRWAVPTLERLAEISRRAGAALPALSLAAALECSAISKVVFGVTREKELSEILDWSLPRVDSSVDAECAELWKLTDGRILDPRIWKQ